MKPLEPTIKELIKARQDAAVIVSRFGESYMPIFSRLNKEIVFREEKLAALELADFG